MNESPPLRPIRVGRPPWPPDAPRFVSRAGSAVVVNSCISSSIMGDPFPMPRPKVGSGRRPHHNHSSSKHFRRYHTYNPSSNKEKVAFTAALKQTLDGTVIPSEFFQKHVSVTASFWFSRPKKHFDSTGRVKPRFASPYINTKKADVDNLVKFLLDCLQGIAIGDDSLVQSIQCEKRWSDYCVLVDGTHRGCGATSFTIQLIDTEGGGDDELCPFMNAETDIVHG